MNTHTKGPWKVAHPIQDADAARHIWTQTDPATGHRELVAIIPDAEGDHVSADARLIAAAPELLDACRCALADLEGLELDSDDCPAALTIKELRAAITKATGV